jgi:hypothetical protein
MAGVSRPFFFVAAGYAHCPLRTDMNRKTASKYLEEEHGIKRSPSTLAKLACLGGGPKFQKAGRQVIYTAELLDAWAEEIKTRPISSTSELVTSA